MAQIFHPFTNTLSKVSVFGAVFVVGGGLWLAGAVQRSTWVTREGVAREQPVPFSHEHHVRGVGLDCRYCHTSVEDAAFAGMPSTEVCVSCHSQIWRDSPALAPVRDSLATGAPLRWRRVHDLPDFVYFDHGVHVAKGVGCSTCHGHVDRMPLTSTAAPLSMEWCLACHRDPAPSLRPRADVFRMDWTPAAPGGRESRGSQLTDCSVCHR